MNKTLIILSSVFLILSILVFQLNEKIHETKDLNRKLKSLGVSVAVYLDENRKSTMPEHKNFREEVLGEERDLYKDMVFTFLYKEGVDIEVLLNSSLPVLSIEGRILNSDGLFSKP
ncbi:MAG: hypothetical protein NE327_18625 [Lentisphaeraceae bacterium]|nr:hypothetical protein [Lentisphaeraceae bacterium]